MKPYVCIIGPSKRFLSGISYYTIRLANALLPVFSVSVLYYRTLLPKALFPGRSRIDKCLASTDLMPVIPVMDGMDYNNPLTWLKAFKFLNRMNPDVLVFQWWTSSVAHMHIVLSIWNSLFIKSRIIIEFHEVVDPLEESILPIRVYSRITGRLLRSRAAAYITHSESDKKLISEKYNIVPEKIYVVPHGLYDQYHDLDKYAAKKRLHIKEDYVVLHFGLIRTYKGIPYLIRAFEKLQGDIINKSRLLIVGEIWDDRKELVSQISNSPARDHITLVDRYVSDEEVPLYFSAADVIVLPYTRASQSGTAHIAMTFGKPIIVSEVGGLKESMADYGGTVFVAPEDIDAISKSLTAIYGHEGSYEDSYKAPDTGWEVTAMKYKKVIESVII